MEAVATPTINPNYDADRHELFQFVPADARRLLDIGCHAGAFGGALKKLRPIEIWGIEPDAAACAVAAKHLDRTVVGKFESGVDVPDGYFDVITFNDSLEHFPDPVPPLLLARQKLALDGVLVVVLPNMRYIDSIMHLLVHKDWEYEECGVRDRTHLRFFTLRSMTRLFTNLGFVVERQKGINSYWFRPEKIVPWALVRVLPFWLGDMRYQQYVNVLRAPAGRATTGPSDSPRAHP